MEDSQKRNSSVNMKDKDPLQDLEIGNDFFSWKSISMAEGDELDFDLTPVSKGNKKTFNFDKADMDFNLDTDFGKISSFNLDMSDLDISTPLKKDAKPKEKLEETSTGKDKGKTDQLSFGFDFDELENFSFDLSTKIGSKTQRDKNNKESSSNGSGCLDKEGSVNINESGSSSIFKDGSQKPSAETRITFDMDYLVGVADLEPTRKICPIILANDDAVTSEHSTAIDPCASDRAMGPQETISVELPTISPSKTVSFPGKIDLEAGIKNDIMPEFSSDHISNNESEGNSSAAEKNVDINACSNVEQDGSLTQIVGSTRSDVEQDGNLTQTVGLICNQKYTISGNSQHPEAVAVSGNVDEPSGGNSSTAENKVSCMDTNVSGSNGEQHANMIQVSGSTCIHEHISKDSQNLQAVSISENIGGAITEDGTEDHGKDNRRTELRQTNSHVENSCMTGAVSGIKESQKPSCEILKSSFISQPAYPSDEQTENIKEPIINSSRPLIQSEKPEYTVLKASTQAMFSSLSSKKMGFAQPSLVEGRVGDATQRDRKLFSLSLQCSKTLLRGNIPQIRNQESCNNRKICGESHIADRLQNGNKLNDSISAQARDTVKTECAPRQRELCTNTPDTLSMETNRKTAENSGNPKKLASIPSNKINTAQEQKTWSIESSQKPPDLPGPKLSRLSIGSTKSPIWRESKSLETSNHKSVVLRKSPPGITRPLEKSKQATSILSMKRGLEDATADAITLHPSKRLLQSGATTRSIVETSEKVMDKKAPNHSHMEYECIKSKSLHQVKTIEVEISSSRNDSNIKLADACSKELDDLCVILRKKHDEAKDLLVRATVNSNKLLLLNHPQLEQKISLKLYTLCSITIHANPHFVKS